MKHPENLQAGQTAPEEEFEPVNKRKNQDKHREITPVDLIQKHLIFNLLKNMFGFRNLILII